MDDKYINIDGELKHRYNSEGKLIHNTDEGIKQFHKWFDKSTSIDEQGRPRVFYHGTDSDFDTFKPQKGKTSTIFGTENVERQGHFFTPSLDFAKEFTKSGNVMKVYLKMHKPFDLRSGITQEMYNTVEQHGMNPRWLTSNHIDDWERFDGEDGTHFKDVLHKSGHDSAIIFEPHGKEAREAHIVFNPNQIKSATDNKGNFDISKESINESVEFPEEAIVGHLKEMRDSGRYDITHNGYDDRYDHHEFTTIAKPSRNATPFHYQKGRSERSWYNPDIAELHTPYPDDPYSRTYPRIKESSGYTPEVDDTRTPGVLYRGMSHEEFKNIKNTGFIKSHGEYNLGGQEGLTYYSRDPGQANSYAHSFAPAQFKASGKHNVYVVAVKDPNTEVKIAGTGEDEVGIPHAISSDDILHVHVGKAYASTPGRHVISKDWHNNYSDGSSSSPSTYVAWKKMKFDEL